MVTQTVKVKNRAGIHARPAMVIVQATLKFTSNIYLEKNEYRVNAKSIMGVITLAAAYGTELTIIAEGEDEKEALAAMINLFDINFEEE